MFCSLALITVIFTLFSSMAHTEAGFLGGRAFITGRPAYHSGPCYLVDGIETCPIGYTPCLDGHCYFIVDSETVVRKAATQ